METQTTPSSISLEDGAECGCNVSSSDQNVEGIVPETRAAVLPVMPNITVNGEPGTYTLNSGMTTPANVTINFNHYPGHMVPMMDMEPEPKAVVKVFEDKTVVKILNESGEEVDHHYDEEGDCETCEKYMAGPEYAAVTKPYGDVRYADPGYRDGKARYPIDTEAHVRAALAYINMPKNADKYTPEQLETIKGRIHAAAKKLGIEVAEESDEEMGIGYPYPAMVAGAAPLAPPASWFKNPELQGPTRLTIQEDGHVYGHLAQWRVCHLGIGNACVVAPKTQTDYQTFKIGSIVCDDGSQVDIGKIVMGTAHANAQWGVMPARDFYDNVSMSAAIVNVGEDRHGIWVNGTLTTNMDPEKIALLRASALSGDWRRTSNGNLELVAALAVNSPGFPIYRESQGRAFSLQAVGVLETEDVTGELSMASDESAQEFSVMPTGIESEDNEQAERLRRLQEITDGLEQHRREQRFAQLAVLDEEREQTTDFRPRNYSNSSWIRGEFNGSKIKTLPEPESYTALPEEEGVEQEPAPRKARITRQAS